MPRMPQSRLHARITRVPRMHTHIHTRTLFSSSRLQKSASAPCASRRALGGGSGMTGGCTPAGSSDSRSRRICHWCAGAGLCGCCCGCC